MRLRRLAWRRSARSPDVLQGRHDSLVLAIVIPLGVNERTAPYDNQTSPPAAFVAHATRVPATRFPQKQSLCWEQKQRGHGPSRDSTGSSSPTPSSPSSQTSSSSTYACFRYLPNRCPKTPDPRARPAAEVLSYVTSVLVVTVYRRAHYWVFRPTKVYDGTLVRTNFLFLMAIPFCRGPVDPPYDDA